MLKEEARKKEAELAGLRGHLALSTSAKAGLEAKLLTVQTSMRALRTDFGRLIGHMEKKKSECVKVQEHHRCLGKGTLHSIKYLHIKSTEQCLASSELLTHSSPLHPANVSSPRTKGDRGGYTLAPR